MTATFNTVEEQEREIVRVARRILSGDVGIIAGAREMTCVRFRSHTGEELDHEFLYFIDIASKTDHLPVGDVRRLWAADALIRKDAEINEAEDLFRERALEAARILIERYEPKGFTSTSPSRTKRMQATTRMASVVSSALPARGRLIRDVLLKMIPTRHITRTTALWCGVAFLALGIAVAAVAFYSRVRARNSPHDAEAMAGELRANGAIVENYYKVLGSRYHPPSPQSPPVRLGGYIAAGVLVAAGGILILKAPSFPSRETP